MPIFPSPPYCRNCTSAAAALAGSSCGWQVRPLSWVLAVTWAACQPCTEPAVPCPWPPLSQYSALALGCWQRMTCVFTQSYQTCPSAFSTVPGASCINTLSLANDCPEGRLELRSSPPSG